MPFSHGLLTDLYELTTAQTYLFFEEDLSDASALACSYSVFPRSGTTCSLAASTTRRRFSSPSSPWQNGIAERFVRTARSECLDWLLILNARHLERTPTVFIDHYNAWRLHRSLGLAPPNGRTSAATWTGTRPIMLKRRDRFGGLLHEYERAA